MKKRYFLKGNEFTIRRYNNAKQFASFLPGIAGLYGKPTWAFYVNRGQCMASFGTRNKNGAIMEFYPANTAYRRTPLEGFRTFIKHSSYKAKEKIYEPFRLHTSSRNMPPQTLYVLPHEFRIEEISREHSLKTEVVYFTLPGEDFPALARILRVENLSPQKKEVEIIDGMPKVCPFGMNEFFMKHMSRTIEAWMEVEGVSDRMPFYRLRVNAADVSRIEYITRGNFYLSVTDERRTPEIIVDPALVFGDFDDFTSPGGFAEENFKISKDQRTRNTTPSAFSYCRFSIPPKTERFILSLIGHVESRNKLEKISVKMSKKFFEDKRLQNKSEIEDPLSSARLFSGAQTLDAYVTQTNLDNILRGGYPISLGDDRKVLYVFNRKHGDLERDYNNFVLRPEFYSQGNGNFRDANQNRRSSVWLNPAVGDKDIKDFYNLMQLDGFNPLVIKGDIFSIREAKERKALTGKYFHKKDRKNAEAFLSAEFTPGGFMKFVENKKIMSPLKTCFEEIINAAACRIDAEHRDGYWIDHWSYNLDLVESYLGLFPEKATDILFKEKDFIFFDSAHTVKPRSARYVKDGNGLKQYNSVRFDKEKQKLIDSRKDGRPWVRERLGKGAIYRCTLATKILTLIVNKMASIDASGRGIEMEADKPGWCDSLNGLPGVMGSSICETAELLRLVEFFRKALVNAGNVSVSLPIELSDFLKGLTMELRENLSGNRPESNHKYWDNSNALKEVYREKTRFGLHGRQREINKEKMLEFLSLFTRKLKRCIRGNRNKEGIPYTYFINEAKIFDKNKKVYKFTSRPLAVFLEGGVHLLKIEKNKSRAATLYSNIRKSELYDRKLRMYKLNAPIDKESLEIGRTRIFTPGWLENESIWLHMEYKYLLEVLRRGLYGKFYDDFKNVLIPFQDPHRYGRSTLENSSFLVSSKFFNKDLHGTGFVARLTGATAEFLHILRIMNLGEKPFSVMDNKLIFRPTPALHKMLFTKKDKVVEFRFKNGKKGVKINKNSYAFSMFTNTLIIYNNPKRKNTFGANGVKPVQFSVSAVDGKKSVLKAPYLGEPFSTLLREGRLESISILL